MLSEFRIKQPFCCLIWFYILTLQFFLTTHGGTLISTEIGPKPMWNYTYVDKLRQDLLLNYDKHARPTQHFNTTTVQFGFSVIHIEVNEFKSAVTMHGFVRMMWKDEKLQWKPEKYGNITSLHLADHEIWQPDVFLYNSASSTPIIGPYGKMHCLASPTGNILWVPPVTSTVICNLQLRYWPYESQVCDFVFGSWTYNGEQINLQILGNETEAKLELLVSNTEWTITKTAMAQHAKFYDCCEEPFHDVTITMYLKRNSPLYHTTLVIPAFAILALILFGHLLPPQCGEKIILNGCTAVIVTLYMMFFSQKVPPTGSHIPLIVLFYSSTLYLVIFSSISSVIVLYLSKTSHSTAIPWPLRKILHGQFGKYLGLSVYINQNTMGSQRVTIEEMRDHSAVEHEEHISEEHEIIRRKPANATQQDWILLAAAIDRIIFYLFLIVSLLLVGIYLA